MKSFRVRFALGFYAVFIILLAIVNIVENFVNDKLRFHGAFFKNNLTASCIFRIVIFILVIVLSVVFARLALNLAMTFANKSNDQKPKETFFDNFFFIAEIVFFVYVALRLYFSVRELNIASTSFLILGINDFTFELMLMRIFTYAANILYAFAGVCALAGCCTLAKRLADN